MLRLNPKVWQGRWVIDLRAVGFGRRYVLGAESLGREEAVHSAYALLAQLRGERVSEIAQRDLLGERAPQFFGSALDAWQAGKRVDSAGSASYVKLYARLVRADLASYQLSSFAPPEGNQRLIAYVGELERRQLSGRTVRNRVSIVEQVLRHAAGLGWIASPPLHPRMPPKAAPIFRWLTEAMFRSLRAEVYKGVSLAEMRRAAVETDAELELFVARRRMYLSWLFYTGVHHYDADHATADWLFIDGRAYIRHNNKSARCVQDEQFEMPEPLYADLRELEALQGRPFFPAESFTGGPWPECSRVMQKAAVRLKFPHGANPSILRRSYAREMYLRGYTVREVADRMGHADERMLKEIYVRTPRGEGRVKSRWITPSAAPGGSPSGMAVVLKLQKDPA